jgi:hypothetical protein
MLQSPNKINSLRPKKGDKVAFFNRALCYAARRRSQRRSILLSSAYKKSLGTMVYTGSKKPLRFKSFGKRRTRAHCLSGVFHF